jgi:hypothetical protein
MVLDCLRPPFRLAFCLRVTGGRHKKSGPVKTRACTHNILLSAFEEKQHTLITSALFSKSLERLVFG